MSVQSPSESELKAYFEKFKNDLPSMRSPNPGFKEPHRIRYASFMADQKKFEDEAAKTITKKDVEEFYEENKETRFRQSPPDPPVAQEAATSSSDKKSEVKVEENTEERKSLEKNPEAPRQPEKDTEKKASKESSKTKSEEDREQQENASQPSNSDNGSTGRRARVIPVAFQVKEEADKTDSSAKNTNQQPEKTPITGAAIPDSVEEQSAANPAIGKESKEPAESSEPKMTFRPLEEVTEQIRQDISRQRATETIDTIFSALAADVNAYAEDRALWIARGKDGDKEPSPPNVKKIAEKQSLIAVESDWLTVTEAANGGGIGSSFEFVPDPSSRFGIRQQRWLETMFDDGITPPSGNVARCRRNRYFSWKQDDQTVPDFAEARDNVEKAWRIVEARPLALKEATAIVAKLDEKGFVDAMSKAELENVQEIGPFTWLTQGAAGVNAAPALSSPEGLAMPGNTLMQKVFSTAEGKSVAVFNEPQTICYVIRLQAFEPSG